MPDLPPIHPAMVGDVEPNYELMANAIYKAEGGDKTKWPYGIMSPQVKGDKEKARRWSINTARNNYKRWVDAGGKWDGKPSEGTVGESIPYYVYLARKYTPPSADPTGHKNWTNNVPAIYAQLEAQQAQQAQQSMPTNQVMIPPGYAVTNMPNYRP